MNGLFVVSLSLHVSGRLAIMPLLVCLVEILLTVECGDEISTTSTPTKPPNFGTSQAREQVAIYCEISRRCYGLPP